MSNQAYVFPDGNVFRCVTEIMKYYDIDLSDLPEDCKPQEVVRIAASKIIEPWMLEDYDDLDQYMLTPEETLMIKLATNDENLDSQEERIWDDCKKRMSGYKYVKSKEYTYDEDGYYQLGTNMPRVALLISIILAVIVIAAVCITDYYNKDRFICVYPAEDTMYPDNVLQTGSYLSTYVMDVLDHGVSVTVWSGDSWTMHRTDVNTLKVESAEDITDEQMSSMFVLNEFEKIESNSSTDIELSFAEYSPMTFNSTEKYVVRVVRDFTGTVCGVIVHPQDKQLELLGGVNGTTEYRKENE